MSLDIDSLSDRNTLVVIVGALVFAAGVGNDGRETSCTPAEALAHAEDFASEVERRFGTAQVG